MDDLDSDFIRRVRAHDDQIIELRLRELENLPPSRQVEDVCADLPCMHPHVQRLAGGGHYCVECQQEVHVT